MEYLLEGEGAICYRLERWRMQASDTAMFLLGDAGRGVGASVVLAIAAGQRVRCVRCLTLNPVGSVFDPGSAIVASTGFTTGFTEHWPAATAAIAPTSRSLVAARNPAPPPPPLLHNTALLPFPDSLVLIIPTDFVHSQPLPPVSIKPPDSKYPSYPSLQRDAARGLSPG